MLDSQCSLWARVRTRILRPSVNMWTICSENSVVSDLSKCLQETRCADRNRLFENGPNKFFGYANLNIFSVKTTCFILIN